jgi:hypothetical protein
MRAMWLMIVFVLGLASAGSALAQTAATGSVAKSIRAVSYQLGSTSKVDLEPSDIVPHASGEAKQGAEFLTYVVWVVSPDGRAANVGEIQPDDSQKGKLKATTPLQTFSLFVTAEPYFAVRQPGEMVVLMNALRKDTKGKIVIVDNYPPITRTQYQKMGNPLALTPDLKSAPLEMYEARNAVEIAKSRAEPTGMRLKYSAKLTAD